MKASLSLLLGFVAFAYSPGCVISYEHTGSEPSNCFLYPIAPGIWVGVEVNRYLHGNMLWSYVAGIGTMTMLGALFGSFIDFLSDKRHPRSA